MRKLHACRSCGHLSTAGEAFKRITAANGSKVKVCDDCAEDYGRDANVTRWANEAAAADAAKQACKDAA